MNVNDILLVCVVIPIVVILCVAALALIGLVIQTFFYNE